MIAGGQSKHVCIYSIEDEILIKKFQVTKNKSFDAMSVSCLGLGLTILISLKIFYRNISDLSHYHYLNIYKCIFLVNDNCLSHYFVVDKFLYNKHLFRRKIRKKLKYIKK